MPSGSSISTPIAGDRSRRRTFLAWIVFVLLVAIHLPAYLCMGLDVDISMYDLVARRVLRGDVHYRDLLETNFPGIVWLHMIVRSLFGWRPEVLKSFDFLMVSGSAWLLANWLPRSAPAWGKPALASVLFAFYFSLSEWCYCQRDIWMMFPCLWALRLRTNSAERSFRRSIGEGLLWGLAVWIKPFVMVPAIACWLVSVRHELMTPGGFRCVALDFAGMLSGGLIAGGAGFGWLWGTGALNAFLDVMLVWNREYFVYDCAPPGPWWLGPLLLAKRFFPWIFVHLAAVPLALSAVFRRATEENRPMAIYSMCYLAWLAQAFVLQHIFDYVHVPAVMLGVSLLAAGAWDRFQQGSRAVPLMFLVCCVFYSQPRLWESRLPAWFECVRNGSTPVLRDRIGVMGRIDWQELDRVREYLKDQHAADGEVSCFNMSMVSIIGDLNLRPATRYLFLQEHLNIFRNHRSEILADLAVSRQRYVVCDLKRPEMQTMRHIVETGGLAEPAPTRADRTAFRAGDYVVFRVDGPEMTEWLNAYFPR